MKMRLKSQKEKFLINLSSGILPTLGNKFLFIVLISILFRFLNAVPVPGVPIDSLKEVLSQYSFGEILNITSSGALANTTLIAIGLGPHINASVVFQLLGSVVPKIQELQKEGVKGRMVLNMYTRLLTVPLAIIQSIVIYLFLKEYQLVAPLSGVELGVLVAGFTGGSMLLMWLSELLTEDNFINGSSYLIAAGILADVPGKFSLGEMANNNWVIVGVLLFTFLWIGFIGYVMAAVKKIKIKHAKVMSFATKPIDDNHLPLRLNQSGVMPVIFAMSFMSTPSLVMDLLSRSDLAAKYQWIANVSEWVTKYMGSENIYYSLILASLIVVFSVFYTFVVFSPHDTSENLKKQGAYIPGIRPGSDTKQYLTKIMVRLSIVGSMFLAFITIFPILLPKFLISTWNYTLPSFLGSGVISKNWVFDVPFLFSGTAIIIIVGVAVEVFDKIRSMQTDRYSVKGI